MRRVGNKMAEIKYEIVKELAVLSEGSKGWSKELNLIIWNDREPKYDIRKKVFSNRVYGWYINTTYNV